MSSDLRTTERPLRIQPLQALHGLGVREFAVGRDQGDVGLIAAAVDDDLAIVRDAVAHRAGLVAVDQTFRVDGLCERRGILRAEVATPDGAKRRPAVAQVALRIRSGQDLGVEAIGVGVFGAAMRNEYRLADARRQRATSDELHRRGPHGVGLVAVGGLEAEAKHHVEHLPRLHDRKS